MKRLIGSCRTSYCIDDHNTQKQILEQDVVAHQEDNVLLSEKQKNNDKLINVIERDSPRLQLFL